MVCVMRSYHDGLIEPQAVSQHDAPWLGSTAWRHDCFLITVRCEVTIDVTQSCTGDGVMITRDGSGDLVR
jgi:hypothetical protein